ncbi:3-hexulose-6-phosphate synthase [Actinomycetospora soli]|uniref:3-hexulose-6-phosphate synthase n=1 Tax=Actinomycetospora soli TaxID=2893887 RepID=UPI001E52F7BB|nr:3-hexulose-6-phosphate synthase [Actinomycetospora soli]MCD2191263.1 orotidine 5'-phosphate decarboxylase [Actinomycetospora soli]
MKLQVAMDVATLDEALALSRQVADYVDIIELGTPLIKHEGIAAVSAIKAAHPEKEVFADMKTADAGELEAGIAFAAGADYVTVMGAADDDTIRGAVKSAQEYGRQIVADMITVKDRAERARAVTELGVAFCEIHAGLDEQAQEGYSIQTVIDDGKASGVPFSIAGGVNIDSIRDVQAAGATVAVAGGAIRNADDPAAAAKELRGAITS